MVPRTSAWWRWQSGLGFDALLRSHAGLVIVAGLPAERAGLVSYHCILTHTADGLRASEQQPDISLGRPSVLTCCPA